MTTAVPRPALKGKKALVAGIANEHSIATGCARAFRELGAEVAITYLNEKAKRFVEPIATQLESPIFLPLDVSQPGELEALFERIAKDWARSTSWCTRSPGRRRATCRAGCSSAPPRASPRRWTSPAIRSCAWRGSLRR